MEYLIPIILLPYLILRYGFNIGSVKSVAVSLFMSPVTAFAVVALAYFAFNISGSGPLAMVLATGCLVVGIPVGALVLWLSTYCED